MRILFRLYYYFLHIFWVVSILTLPFWWFIPLFFGITADEFYDNYSDYVFNIDDHSERNSISTLNKLRDDKIDNILK